jgi:hypothetical protein
VRGKQLYNNLPGRPQTCVDCHLAPIQNNQNILSAAGNFGVIGRAIDANKGGMGQLKYTVDPNAPSGYTGLNGYDMIDIAAYLAQPNL